MTDTRRPSDLREACLAEALDIIDAEGVEALSLREVARRLGVSHQAPYKHFDSRDHILAAVVSRAFDAFAAHLDAVPKSGRPRQDLAQMGIAYLSYARSNPLQYRLMFNTPLPQADHHPEMWSKGKHSFAMLTSALSRLKRASSRDGAAPPPDADAQLHDALFIWFALHGFSSVFGSSLVGATGLSEEAFEGAEAAILARIEMVIDQLYERDPRLDAAGDAPPPK